MDHGDAYVVAERLIEFDELFQTFRFQHLQLIRRSIGAETKSLKGRPIEALEQGVKHRFFPGSVGGEKPHDRRLGRRIRR